MKQKACSEATIDKSKVFKTADFNALHVIKVWPKRSLNSCLMMRFLIVKSTQVGKYQIKLCSSQIEQHRGVDAKVRI